MARPPRIPRSVPTSNREPREGMSANHLAMIRQLPCVVTGEPASEAHHILRTGEHGMGRRSSDRWAIPLSTVAHRALHAAGDEEVFLIGHGIDGRAVASALWAARGDIEAMRQVIFNARQRAALNLRGAA